MGLPLAPGATSAVDATATSARFGSLRDDADVSLPMVQLHAASTIRLADHWDAGPSIVLNLASRGRPEDVTGGLFVRYWAPADPDADLVAALRFEAGWGWGGLGLDLAFLVAEDASVTLGPTVLITPEFVAARFPIGAYAHLGPLDLGVEGGALAAVNGSFRRVSPWMGLRVRLTFGTE
ncbi:MAG: hypothetical protein AB8H79_18740 [Myxococcota bacterium]